MTPEQCRTARLALKWNSQQLAARIGVCSATVRVFEGGRRHVRPQTVAALRDVLEAAGIQFISEGGDRDGVRLGEHKA